MKRQDKYPNTTTFTFFNANPKGRYTTDCTVRAISMGTGIPYKTVVMEMAELQCETGYDADENKLIGMYLESKGWVQHKQPKKDHDGHKYTGKEFCRFIQQYYKDVDSWRYVIANIGSHHIAAIVHGKVIDTWDCTDGCIGIYWTKGGVK